MNRAKYKPLFKSLGIHRPLQKFGNFVGHFLKCPNIFESFLRWLNFFTQIPFFPNFSKKFWLSKKSPNFCRFFWKIPKQKQVCLNNCCFHSRNQAELCSASIVFFKIYGSTEFPNFSVQIAQQELHSSEIFVLTRWSDFVYLHCSQQTLQYIHNYLPWVRNREFCDKFTYSMLVGDLKQLQLPPNSVCTQIEG